MGRDLFDTGGGLILVVLIFVVIFLIGREFFCWYWKINQTIALLTEVRDYLARGSFAQSGTTVTPVSSQTRPSSQNRLATFDCPQCGTTIYQRVAQCMFCQTALTDEAIDAAVETYKAQRGSR